MSDDRYQTRVATPADVTAIADAHRDSIRTLGPAFYPPEAVEDWQAAVTPGMYLEAMDRGEVFFIATTGGGADLVVLGFSSDYPIEGTRHGASVYMRGTAARRGIGSTLLGLAEARAVERGATEIHIEASLAGVAFYAAHGFVEAGRGETRLTTGRPIECVFMRKRLQKEVGAHFP